MRQYTQFYIDGRWVEPVELKTLDVENPATEEVCGQIALGSAADVDQAVAAAQRAFAGWSQSGRGERLDLLRAIQAEYQRRRSDLADAVNEEMGAPPALAAGLQVDLGAGHLA
ncbi:aldehyde dehydrogenase family protein, partial [Mycobacterium stomatepiae]